MGCDKHSNWKARLNSGFEQFAELAAMDNDSLLTLLRECTYDRIGILQGAVLPAFD